MELIRSGKKYYDNVVEIMNDNFDELSLGATGTPDVEVLLGGKIFSPEVRRIFNDNFETLATADSVAGIKVIPYGKQWDQTVINIINDNLQAIDDAQ